MRRILLYILFLMLTTFYMSAQSDYHTFKVDVGMLVGDVSEHNVGLMAPYIEPKFNINNNITIGIRAEYVFYTKEDFIKYDPQNPYFSDFDADGWTMSVLPTIDYYFSDTFIRPFVGIGAGVYYMYNTKENSFDFNHDQRVVAFGYAPRIGFNIGQFRIAAEYNAILSEEVTLNYFAFKVGYEIGGGKKWF